jgi:hypothetical protein
MYGGNSITGEVSGAAYLGKNRVFLIITFITGGNYYTDFLSFSLSGGVPTQK